MIKDIYEELKKQNKKTISYFSHQLMTVRAGRANPAILDNVFVDYYGTPTPLKQLASISTPEARLIVISPYDKNAIADIEKAILKSDLGLNPSNDGKVVRLQIPMLTEENRRDLTKVVKKYSEEAKIALRNERRNAITHLKELEKESEITEDDLAKAEKKVQEMIDDSSKKVDETLDEKIKEIMEV